SRAATSTRASVPSWSTRAIRRAGARLPWKPSSRTTSTAISNLSARRSFGYEQRRTSTARLRALDRPDHLLLVSPRDRGLLPAVRRALLDQADWRLQRGSVALRPDARALAGRSRGACRLFSLRRDRPLDVRFLGAGDLGNMRLDRDD